MQGFLEGIFPHLKLSCPFKLRLNDELACNWQAYSIISKNTVLYIKLHLNDKLASNQQAYPIVSKNTVLYIFENLDLPMLNIFYLTRIIFTVHMLTSYCVSGMRPAQ